jgi:hypothetical protein
MPAPCIAASTISRDESNTGPLTVHGSTCAASNQPSHSSVRYERSSVSFARSAGRDRRRAMSGAHSALSGASSSRSLRVAGQLPSPKRIAKSRPSPARSTTLLLVRSRSSTNGCVSPNLQAWH